MASYGQQLREMLRDLVREVLPPQMKGSGTEMLPVAVLGLGTCAAAAAIGRLLWAQYSMLLFHQNLPEHDLGLPLLGHSLGVLKASLNEWIAQKIKGRDVLVTNFLGDNVTIVTHDIYMKYIHSDDVHGLLGPSLNSSLVALTGKNSVLNIPGGTGHDNHKRLRRKILGSFGPKPVLACSPRLLEFIRKVLDKAVLDTTANGFARFEPLGAELASKASTTQITYGVDPAVQDRMLALMHDIAAGLISIPINLGKYSIFGKALIARKEMCVIISDLMKSTTLSHKNLVYELMHASEDGEAFQVEEIVDTVLTLFIAGQLTTADALPALLIQLHHHRAWAAKVAEEPLSLPSAEEDSATLRVVREALRLKPPAGLFRREALDPSVPVSLGPHGTVPAGSSVAFAIGRQLLDMGSDFNPDRWTKEAVREFGALAFGGSQPHTCIGKTLTLVELQLFARVLCREYDFEVLSDETWVSPKNPLGLSYKDGLRVKFWHKQVKSA